MSEEQNLLKNTLYPYLKKTLASYEMFLAKETWSGTKEFTAYHSACRAVLSHIALLMKLIETPKTSADDTADLTEWIERAKTAVSHQEDSDVEFD
ncbi:MAG: hypothetical protein ACI4QM_04760 [Alphaproteobacteria bacterium]